MGLTDRIVSALRNSLQVEYARLEDDDGVSGFVVSPQFEDLPTLDRQQLIDDALRNSPDPFSAEEQRRILMIAGLTRTEYELVGAPVRVHRIREVGDGSVEIFLHGGRTDAEYVRGALSNQKGVTTTEPSDSPGGAGIFTTFLARGSDVNPLTEAMVERILSADPYIAVMNSA